MRSFVLALALLCSVPFLKADYLRDTPTSCSATSYCIFYLTWVDDQGRNVIGPPISTGTITCRGTNCRHSSFAVECDGVTQDCPEPSGEDFVSVD